MLKRLIAKLKCNRGEVGSTDSAGTEKSGATTDSSQSGEKLEGLIQDLDFTDIPEDKREEIKKLVAQKVKQYDTGFRTKSEDIATQRKELESTRDSLRDLQNLQQEIQGIADFVNGVNKTINDFRAGRINTEKKVDKSLSKLDQLINEAESADQREQLKTMREIIQQETKGDSSSSDEIKILREEIAGLKKMNNVGLTGAIKSSVKTLRDNYGDEIIEKYAPQINEMLSKYPSYIDNPSKVLFNLADDSEIFDAYDKIKTKRQQVENKRKEDGVFPGGSSTPTAIEKPRTKTGAVDIKKYVSKLAQAGKFK